jgi:UDP-N-acetyl-alpha-D-muramoyl-L-alanyl-L-glutamate epimerase
MGNDEPITERGRGDRKNKPMSPKAEELRRKHPRFFYQSFDVERAGNDLKITFHFKLEPDIIFTPDIVIESIDRSRIDSLDTPMLERLAFHLGLIEMLSYWKTACPAEVVIEAGALDQWQIRWWKELWLRGMGEFFYVNQIDFRNPDYLKISALTPPARDGRESRNGRQPARRSLVMVSGGKDSAFTVHELRAAGEDFNCLLLNPPPSAVEVAAIAGCTAPITVRRTLDPRMLDLNRQGYLNGHTPFSALLAILGLTCATLFDYDRVVVSNERSSDEGNVHFLGTEINHQYSKTFAFETAIREYARDYLAPGVSYFSIVRPLFEIQVCRLFAHCPEYFRAFKSCNREQKQGTWCGQCPKCLSVFISLAPFVSRSELLGIFRKDVFEDAGAITLVRSLLGIEGTKPFECVGTRQELLVGLFLSIRRRKAECATLPALLARAEGEILPSVGIAPDELNRLSASILSSWSDRHYLPPDYARALKSQLTVSDDAS